MSVVFFCTNSECEKHQDAVVLDKVTYVFTEGKLVPKKRKCDICKEYMVHEEYDEPQTVPDVHFGRFASASEGDKKRILQKRAGDANKKAKDEMQYHYEKQMKNMIRPEFR